MFNRNLKIDIDNLIMSKKNELEVYLQELIDIYDVEYHKKNDRGFIYAINHKFVLDDKFIKALIVAQKKLSDIGIKIIISLSLEYPINSVNGNSRSMDIKTLLDIAKEYPKELFGNVRGVRIYLYDK